MVVEGAELVNGLLHIHIRREVPESAKPRRIPINTNTQAPQQIQHAA
jgi:molecular chaperone IbpA